MSDKKELEEIKNKIFDFKRDTKQAKEKAIEETKTAKEMAKNFEKQEEFLGITDEIICAVEPNIDKCWETVEDWWMNSCYPLEKQNKIAKDYIFDQIPVSEETSATTYTTASISSNAITNLHDELSNLGIDFGPQFEVIDVKETISENEQIIESFLDKIDKEWKRKFNEITINWASTKNPEKYVVLGELRNFIFSVVLNKLAPRPEVVQCNWEQKLKYKENKRQIGPVKYFILGKRNESTLQNIADIIDDVAENLGKDFGELSNYSKQGIGTFTKYRITYRNTLSHFVDAIQLREILATI